MLSKQQLFDRKEWLQKLKANVLARKVVVVTLSPRGVTLAEIRAFLGRKFDAVDNGGKVTIAVKQEVASV